MSAPLGAPTERRAHREQLPPTDHSKGLTSPHSWNPGEARSPKGKAHGDGFTSLTPACGHLDCASLSRVTAGSGGSS